MASIEQCHSTLRHQMYCISKQVLVSTKEKAETSMIKDQQHQLRGM